jgi:LuxR family maltose regulon positive regulatory protein
MLEHSELATLMKWADALPEEQVIARPWLCIYHAWALRLTGSPYDIVESRLLDADQAVHSRRELLSEEEDRKVRQSILDELSRLECQINAVRAFQALYCENIPRVIELAHQVQICRSESAFVRTSTAFALGWAYRFSGNLVDAIKEFTEASAFAMRSENIYMAVGSTCRAAHSLILGGKLSQALSSLEDAVRMAARGDGKQFPVAGYAYVYIGSLYYEWNDLDTASNYLEEGIEQCKRVGYLMDQAVGYAYLARVKGTQGDWQGAQDAIQIAENLAQKMKGYIYVQRWVEDGWVRYWTAQEELEPMGRAHLALAQDQPNSSHLESVLNLLSQLRVVAENAGWIGKLIEILVLQALAFQVKGDEEEALTTLTKALTLAEPEGYVRTFIDEGQPMAVLLRLAASRDVTPTYTRKILTAFDLDGKLEQYSLAQSLLEPLSKRELEVLRLLASDLSGPEIAQELSVALSTVRYHSNNIYGKLSVHNRRAAVHRAEELDIL